MNFKIVTCCNCFKIYPKDIRHVNENLRHGHKFYCSLTCLKINRTKKIEVICQNLRCNRTFYKLLNQYLSFPTSYCSRSCAVSVNNQKYPKRIAVIHTCQTCNVSFKGQAEKYCSVSCAQRGKSYSKEEIIKFIQVFYKQEKRIPLKREFKQAIAARRRFGSWNKAIVVAGFEPNPVLFAKKWIANDGHKCNSLAEKIMDDWLNARKLSHEREIPYHANNMTADFKVKDIFIEFVGLEGVVKKYDENLKRKRRMWKRKKLQVIEVFPKDLFPKNKLEEVLLPFL